MEGQLVKERGSETIVSDDDDNEDGTTTLVVVESVVDEVSTGARSAWDAGVGATRCSSGVESAENARDRILDLVVESETDSCACFHKEVLVLVIVSDDSALVVIRGTVVLLLDIEMDGSQSVVPSPPPPLLPVLLLILLLLLLPILARILPILAAGVILPPPHDRREDSICLALLRLSANDQDKEIKFRSALGMAVAVPATFRWSSSDVGISDGLCGWVPEDIREFAILVALVVERERFCWAAFLSSDVRTSGGRCGFVPNEEEIVFFGIVDLGVRSITNGGGRCDGTEVDRTDGTTITFR
jgi:hypothetical protein